MSASQQRILYVLKHPGAFAWGVVRAFRANQALLLSGAVAYYTLLSLVPLLTLMLIASSGIIDQEALLATLRRYLEWLIPGQSAALVTQLAHFLEHRASIGWVLLATMLFFSSLAFTVLENAMSVIFLHRVVTRRRHYLVSAIIPYCYIVCLACGLLLITLVSGLIQAIGAQSIGFLGHNWSLDGISGALLYLMGLCGEILVLTSIYLVMPVGAPSWRHALIGGVTATALWEITRRILVWYFGTLSQVSVVYGSLTAAIVVLASLDFAATLLLFGAQVIAEYERIGVPTDHADPPPLRT
jgi:YihY family inner membrane protein